jgi:hypothetical protein
VPEEDPRWRAQLDQLATQIERWTGNPARIAEVAEQEISRLRDRDRPIIRELRTDALVLSGANIPELLGEE